MLALYNRFGAMAYGVILQIIPQEHVAQEVLLDIFSSAELATALQENTHPTGTIIRLARLKALQIKEKTLSRTSSKELSSDGRGYLPEHIFDLSFRQGYTPDAIAGHLGISKPEVLKAIREYILMFRQA